MSERDREKSARERDREREREKRKEEEKEGKSKSHNTPTNCVCLRVCVCVCARARVCVGRGMEPGDQAGPSFSALPSSCFISDKYVGTSYLRARPHACRHANSSDVRSPRQTRSPRETCVIIGGQVIVAAKSAGL